MTDNGINSIIELFEMAKQYAINIYDDSLAKMEIIINSMIYEGYWSIETLIEDNTKPIAINMFCIKVSSK